VSSPRPSSVPVADVATVDLRDLTSGDAAARRRFVETLGRSLVGTGFVKVAGHAVDPVALAAAYRSAAAVFALPDDAKARCVRPDLHGARGLVPFGREKAKDATVADLKEFWHVGPTGGNGPDNVWPSEVPSFEVEMRALHASMEATAELLLEAVAEHLGLPRRHLADLVVGADSILRVLHYPPVGADAAPGAVRATAHEDINFITLLPAATDDGLQLRDRDGRWCRVDGREGELVVDSGDQLSRYLNGRVPATTHRVVNPDDPGRDRYSMPFFCQPRPEVLLRPPAELVEPGEVVSEPVTAGEFHAKRMEEIRSRATS
jgi:isopenicillin N synthase-like dioxygenase